MKLKIFFYLLFFYFLFAIPFPVFAESEFQTNYQTTYTIGENGIATVIQQITLTNNFSKIYANSYVLSLEGKRPENIKAFQDGLPLQTDISQDNDKTKISLVFPDAVVGKGKSRTFTITYSVNNLASQNGNVWDVTVPKLSSPENVDTYALTLSVPNSFGNPAYISPKPQSKDILPDRQNFIFTRDDLIKAGIVASFGDFQVFDFTLVYHLQNPYAQIGETEVAFPPDTAFQRVYYNNVNPKPLTVRVDEDGNWMAKYKLSPKQNLDIKVNLSTQIFSKPQQMFINEPPNNYYLSGTEFWQVNDPKIKELATSLKTPRNIYNFVVNRLKYDYSRVREDVNRLGAKKALENPDAAICMEFTDLFVALARAAGIPAREINGYAYTENPQIQPLSLVADVLHAWPEYWDNGLNTWKPVDPTWENTTGGIDFFDKFDLSHVAFAIHGKDPLAPIPAGSYKSATNPQKDVYVKFGQLPARQPIIKMESTEPKLVLPLLPSKLLVKIINNGPVAIYNMPWSVDSVNTEILNNPSKTIKFLAPFSETSEEVVFKMPFKIGGKTSTIQARAQEALLEYNIPTKEAYIMQAVGIFATILFIVAGLIFFPRLIKKLYGKHQKPSV